MTLLGATDIRLLAESLGVRPRKSLGQNFVIDANTIRRIVRLAGVPAGTTVLEIGPGLGSLTLELLAEDRRVIAVEVDPVLARQLPRTVAARDPGSAERLTVVNQDGATLGRDLGAPDSLVANLPYNVAVPVLLHCLATFPSLRRSLVMVQAEVADRLAAEPGSRTYGIPSVKVRWFGRVRRAGSVPASVFWPVPRVESGLVAVEACPPPATTATRDEVFALVDLLFAQRRKMIRGTLAAALGGEHATAVLAASGVAGDRRPEQLGLADFVRLAESRRGALGH